MKFSRFKHEYRQSASQLHEHVGEVLRDPDGPFSTRKVYQEYPADRVNPATGNSSYHYDWVVLDLKLVIEVMGEQHYRPVDFGGEGFNAAEEAFYATQHRDERKKRYAEEAGWCYIEIPYDEIEEVDASYIWSKYMANLPTFTPIVDSAKQDKLEKDREYRKMQYRQAKERKKNSLP